MANCRNSRSRPKRKPLRQYKVLLQNDERNEINSVVSAVGSLTPLSQQEAMNRVIEAHKKGISLLLTTHKERAELYKEQFHSHVPPIGIEIEPV